MPLDMDPSKHRSPSPLKAAWAKTKGALHFRTPKKLDGPEKPTSPPIRQPPAPEEIISRPIVELWDEAYDALHQQKKALISQFDALLSGSLAGAIAGGQTTAAAYSGLGKVQRSQLIKHLLDKKIKEVDDGAWKLKFKDHELLVKDLVVPVVGVVQWAKDYVGAALDSSPYTSIAWAGVCLLLPVR